MAFQDRIKELRRVPAHTLIANEKNWRTHSPEQLAALKGLFAEVGIAGAVLAYETAAGLKLVDGHARVGSLGEQEIPVLVLDIEEFEADKILATYDPVSAMAGADRDQLKALLENVGTASMGVQKMLDDLAAVHNVAFEPIAKGAKPRKVEAADAVDDAPPDPEQEPGVAAPPPVAHVRMVQLYLKPDEHEAFMAAVKAIKEDSSEGTETITDVVLAAVLEAARHTVAP